MVSDSVQSHPWDSPGKDTAVGCHFLNLFLSCRQSDMIVHLGNPMRVLKNSYLKAKEIGGHPVKKKLTAFFFFSVQTEQSRGEADNSAVFIRPTHFLKSLLCRAPGTQLQEVRVLFSSKLSYN